MAEYFKFKQPIKEIFGIEPNCQDTGELTQFYYFYYKDYKIYIEDFNGEISFDVIKNKAWRIGKFGSYDFIINELKKFKDEIPI